jgi:hypothetical protein
MIQNRRKSPHLASPLADPRPPLEQACQHVGALADSAAVPNDPRPEQQRHMGLHPSGDWHADKAPNAVSNRALGR